MQFCPSCIFSHLESHFWAPDLVVPACRASIDLDTEEEEGEERTIFTSGGTYYVALNTTYLLIWSLLLGSLLLGALFLSGGAGASSDSGYSGYSGYQQRQDQGHQGHSRQRRQDYGEGVRETGRSVETSPWWWCDNWDNVIDSFNWDVREQYGHTKNENERAPLGIMSNTPSLHLKYFNWDWKWPLGNLCRKDNMGWLCHVEDI